MPPFCLAGNPCQDPNPPLELTATVDLPDSPAASFLTSPLDPLPHSYFPTTLLSPSGQRCGWLVLSVILVGVFFCVPVPDTFISPTFTSKRLIFGVSAHAIKYQSPSRFFFATFFVRQPFGAFLPARRRWTIPPFPSLAFSLGGRSHPPHRFGCTLFFMHAPSTPHAMYFRSFSLTCGPPPPTPPLPIVQCILLGTSELFRSALLSTLISFLFFPSPSFFLAEIFFFFPVHSPPGSLVLSSFCI